MGDIIRLLDSSGEKVVDSVACDYEDSFSLETFGDLCEMHRRASPKEKSFIIARVQTWDPKQPDKAFYSYYNAFHLNKILFQTQNYLGKRFIHRLHVLNPLTNSDIIGNVQYYILKNRSFNTDGVVEIPLLPPAESVELFKPPADDTSLAVSTKTSVISNSELYIPPPTSYQKSRKTSLRLHIDPTTLGGASFKSPGEFTPGTPAIIEVEEDEPGPAWTRGMHAVAEVLDDDSAEGVKSGSHGNIFQASFSKSKAYFRRTGPFSATVAPSESEIMKIKASQKRSMSLTVAQAKDLIPEGVKNRRRTEFSIPITNLPPSKPVHVHQPKKVQAPPGIITRFTVPVPKDDLVKIVPKTYRGHRRSLSYQNAVSASGTPASFEEWVRMVHLEKGQLKDKQMNESGDEYDVVKPFAQTPLQINLNDLGPNVMINGSSIKTCGSEVVQPTTPKLPVDIVPQAIHSVTSKVSNDDINDDTEDCESQVELTVYDAHLIATDNDFLESSKIRAIFRENAVVPDDAKLFEMPEFNGEHNTTPTIEIVGDSLLCDWFYPSPQTLASISPCMRTFHRVKCYIFAILLVLIVLTFILIIVLQGNRISRVPA